MFGGMFVVVGLHMSIAEEHVTDEMTRDMPFELVDETIELVIQYLGQVWM